jgi:UDP-N-acetylmuramoyl-tripeptide--D-alanyl-D-alanine ligase
MINIENLYDLFLKHPVITTDSRKIPTGSLFFALKGDTFDGNSFARKALEQGAAYAVIDNPSYKESDAFILVEDVLSTLQELARHHRSMFNIPVIAITGTNGKTTTKELISKVLSEKFNIIATEGNLNNHIGVPITLLRINKQTEIAVIEMGANHPGEIDFLAKIANPTHGLITNVGKAHLEGFGGFDGVVRTKTELYRYLLEHEGTVFVNRNNPILIGQLQNQKMYTYGFDSSANLWGNIKEGFPFLSMGIHGEEGSITVESHLFGNYNAENILAAATVGNFLGVPLERVKVAIEGYHPSNNRSQVKQTEKNLLILDAYNANPSSMLEAITHFSSGDFENKVVVLGDMLELGKETDEEHMKLLSLIKLHNFSEVYLVGPVFTRLNTERNWFCFQDSELGKMWFDHQPLTGKTILVKGSRGIKLERIIEVL